MLDYRWGVVIMQKSCIAADMCFAMLTLKHYKMMEEDFSIKGPTCLRNN